MASSTSNQPKQQPDPSNSSSSTPHTTIHQQAKLTQQQDLKQSANYIKQLHTLANHLVLSNSDTDPLTTKSNLLDKIATIHQLNDNIDHQLNEEISRNYYNLMKLKRKITNLSQGCRRKLDAMNDVVRIDERIVADNNVVEENDDGDGRKIGHGTKNERSNSNNTVRRLSLQKRCELIDQDLRILEYTLKLINERD